MKYNRYLPLFVPLAVWAAFQGFLFYPASVYVLLVLVNLLLFFTFYQFTRASSTGEKWWNFYILPALLSLSIAAYSVILKNRLLIQFIFLLELVLLYFYLRFAYYYLEKPQQYKVSSIENISLYGNFIIFFFTAASVYGLESFLNSPVWPLVLILTAVAGLIIYQLTWANKIDFRTGLPYLLVDSVVIFELAWSISFLPLNYNVAGFVLAIFYYIITGLSRLHLLGSLDRAKIKLYLGYGLASVLLILLTSRWL